MISSVAIIGVGYVGLQDVIAFASNGINVIAYDANPRRILELQQGLDRNLESLAFASENISFTNDETLLKDANAYLIAIPTPVNEHFVPNLSALKHAAKLVGAFLKKRDIVVLESTVFPGATREILIPILEEKSGLKSGVDFYIGYSSERIVPGNSSKGFEQVVKVISGQSPKALTKIKALYSNIKKLKIFSASSIEVAESSKLLENIQRDVNIALMNEFSQVMKKMNIPFHDVYEAAATKWNFIPFKPGLVGGHCIPEDPYYFIYQANKYRGVTNLISYARQTNEQFVYFIVNTVVQLIIKQQVHASQATVVILGLSYKENVSDTRHSLAQVIYKTLKEFNINVLVYDPIVSHETQDIEWVEFDNIGTCHAMIMTETHKKYLELGPELLGKKLTYQGIFMDIPGAFVKNNQFRTDILYWSL